MKYIFTILLLIFILNNSLVNSYPYDVYQQFEIYNKTSKSTKYVEINSCISGIYQLLYNNTVDSYSLFYDTRGYTVCRDDNVGNPYFQIYETFSCPNSETSELSFKCLEKKQILNYNRFDFIFSPKNVSTCINSNGLDQCKRLGSCYPFEASQYNISVFRDYYFSNHFTGVLKKSGCNKSFNFNEPSALYLSFECDSNSKSKYDFYYENQSLPFEVYCYSNSSSNLIYSVTLLLISISIILLL